MEFIYHFKEIVDSISVKQISMKLGNCHHYPFYLRFVAKKIFFHPQTHYQHSLILSRSFTSKGERPISPI